MEQVVVQRVVEELRSVLTGKFLGKIFQLTPLSFAFDFGLRGDFLLASADPASSRFYLIHRRLRDLEKQSIQLASFGQALRSKLGGAHLVNVSKDPLDRIVRLTFRLDNEGIVFRRLVVQLTGRTANLFLLDELNRILAVLREQPQFALDETYKPPPRPPKEPAEMLALGPE